MGHLDPISLVGELCLFVTTSECFEAENGHRRNQCAPLFVRTHGNLQDRQFRGGGASVQFVTGQAQSEAGQGQKRTFVVAQLAVRWMASLIDAGSDDPEADREALRKLASRSPDVICENGVFYFCVSVKSPCFKSARDLVVDNKVFRAALVAGKRPLVAVTNTVWARNSKFQRMQLQSFEGLSGGGPAREATRCLYVGNYKDLQQRFGGARFASQTQAPFGAVGPAEGGGAAQPLG